MMMKKTGPAMLVGLLLASGLQAHHSFAPHFDASKPVDFAGVITEYEQRNPHAYLHVRVVDADGRSREWRCESHGVTQLSRNGITPEMLSAGTEVRVQGSQHRRDPNMCFFDTVFLDGQAYSVNGPRGEQRQQPEVAQRDSIFGTWLLVPANRATAGPQFMMDYLTEEGKAAVAQYDPFTDDPTYRCEPVAIRRGWFAPGTPMAIRELDNGDIVIQHEWMDIERTVHMDQERIPGDVEARILGYSIGHWEGETLVVETEKYPPGVLNQFVEVEGQPMRGLLHSEELRTVERITFNPQTNRIELSIEHYDPKFFTRDFPVATAEYAPTELEIRPFGCIPEQLK